MSALAAAPHGAQSLALRAPPATWSTRGRGAMPWSPLTRSLWQSRTLVARAASQAPVSLDDLWKLIPSPGKQLAPNDLMFSTDGEGRSDPSQLRDYIKEHSGEWMAVHHAHGLEAMLPVQHEQSRAVVTSLRSAPCESIVAMIIVLCIT